MKRTLKIGITVLVVAALAMSGIALAQTDEQTGQTGEPAIAERIAARLQGLVDDGTITAEQAEAVTATLAEAAPTRHRHRSGPGFGAVAGFLGMEAADFREAIDEHDTLADLATANGSSGDELVAFLVGQVEERLAAAVEDGRIEQEDADVELGEIEERIAEMVNGEIPECAGHIGGRPGPGRFGGRVPTGGSDT